MDKDTALRMALEIFEEQEASIDGDTCADPECPECSYWHRLYDIIEVIHEALENKNGLN